MALKPAGVVKNGLSVVWKVFGGSKKITFVNLKTGEIEF